MGGFGPDINNFGGKPPQQPSMGQSALGGQQPGMGQQNLPFDIMQRFQQMQQPGMGSTQPGMGQSSYGMMQRYQQMMQRMQPQGGQQQQPPPLPMGIAGGIGVPPQPMGGGNPMQDQYQAFMNQTQGRPDNAPMQPTGFAGGDTGMPPMGETIGQPMDRQKQIMTQPPAPNPYAKPIGQEDPRMQAMRNMQQMNFGG
jgi:hypothetical protein